LPCRGNIREPTVLPWGGWFNGSMLFRQSYRQTRNAGQTRVSALHLGIPQKRAHTRERADIAGRGARRHYESTIQIPLQRWFKILNRYVVPKTKCKQPTHGAAMGSRMLDRRSGPKGNVFKSDPICPVATFVSPWFYRGGFGLMRIVISIERSDEIFPI
jgi:hypothetical protein